MNGAQPEERQLSVTPYRPVMMVFVVWHPAFEHGRTIAQSIYEHLYRKPTDLTHHRMGIPIRFRNKPTRGPGTVPPQHHWIALNTLRSFRLWTMHWRSPRRGTLRQTRLVFALHPSPPRTASPGSGQGCPAFRPFGRFSPVAAETSLRKRRPPEPPSRAPCSASPSRKPGCRRRVRSCPP